MPDKKTLNETSEELRQQFSQIGQILKGAFQADLMKALTLWNFPKAELARRTQRQSDILKVMAVLPVKYRYDAVDAAINAAGVHPEQIYMSLSANEHTLALARFYEALTGRHEL